MTFVTQMRPHGVTPREPWYFGEAAVTVQFNPELQFGKSMSGGRVHALVVTPPQGDATVSLLNDRGEKAKVAVQAKAGGAGWTLQNLPEMNYLLVYGTTAATTVKVDGQVLPKLTAGELGARPAGWEADESGNRLVVRLRAGEPGQGEQSQRTTEIEVDFSPS